MTLYELTWFFLIYSFCGWVVEVIYAAVNHGKFINRGFLNGPVCPIYGIGVMAVVVLLNPLKENIFILYIGSVVLTSIIELVTGFLLSKIFHSRWWDYSKEPFNLGGYICLKFSLLWGIACVIIVDNIHPLFEKAVSHFNNWCGYVLFYICIAVMAVDIIDTVSSILKINRRLKNISELAEKIHEFSDGIGSNIAEGAIELRGKVDIEKAREEYEKNKEKHRQLLEKKLHGRRLFKAFPDLMPQKYKKEFLQLKEELEKKYKNRGK